MTISRHVGPPLAACLLLCAAAASAADIATPLRWEVESHRPAAQAWALRSPESVAFEPRFVSYAAPQDLSEASTVRMLYWTNGAALPFAATGSVLSATNGSVRIRWGSEQYPANGSYLYMVQVLSPSATTHRAWGTLSISAGYPGSGATTNPAVYSTIDWATVLQSNPALAGFELAATNTGSAGQVLTRDAGGRNYWGTGGAGDVTAAQLAAAISAVSQAVVGVSAGMTNVEAGIRAAADSALHASNTAAGIRLAILEGYTNAAAQGAAAYAWGNHAAGGYAGTASVARVENFTNAAAQGAAAYGWGDHAAGGYAGTASVARVENFTNAAAQGAAAYAWGDHAAGGYAGTASVARVEGFTNAAAQGAAAYGWGDHALAGYASEDMWEIALAVTNVDGAWDDPTGRVERLGPHGVVVHFPTNTPLPGGVGDNLGNHTATQAVNLADNPLTNAFALSCGYSGALLVTGNLGPNATGIYTNAPDYNGTSCWARVGSPWFIWYEAGIGDWVISETISLRNPSWWRSGGIGTLMIGQHAPEGGASGTATVSWAPVQEVTKPAGCLHLLSLTSFGGDYYGNLYGNHYGSGAGLTDLPLDVRYPTQSQVLAAAQYPLAVTNGGATINGAPITNGAALTISGSAPAGTLIVTNAGSAYRRPLWTGGATDGVQTGAYARAPHIVLRDVGTQTAGQNVFLLLAYTGVVSQAGIAYAADGSFTVPVTGLYSVTHIGAIYTGVSSFTQVYCGPTNAPSSGDNFVYFSGSGSGPLTGSGTLRLVAGTVYGVYSRHSEASTETTSKMSLNIVLVDAE